LDQAGAVFSFLGLPVLQEALHRLLQV